MIDDPSWRPIALDPNKTKQALRDHVISRACLTPDNVL
jgi:hypothetical protein